MKTNKKNIIGLAAILTLAIAAIAFAHDGYGRHMGGYGGHMMGPVYGGGHMMGYDSDDGPYRRGYGAWGNLSDENAAKLDAFQEKIYKETRELRHHCLKGGPREQKNQHLDELRHLRCIDRSDHMVSIQSS